MSSKIGQLSKPSDISADNLSGLINTIHDKLNEIIKIINTTDKKVPTDNEGVNNTVRAIEDQSTGAAKVGIKVNGTWYTVEATEE
jgi:methyl-accepting chemotaxis protein